LSVRARGLALAALTVVLLLASGCTEDERQQLAREAVQDWVRARPLSGHRVDGAHCTPSARSGWFKIAETELFLCAVRREAGGCDWVSVRMRDRGPLVAVESRDAGCVLPD
jgi:hypothetical protein